MDQVAIVSTTKKDSLLKRMAMKAVSLVLTGILLGFAYDWVMPRFYGPERKAGFPLGVVHGALMPVALPSLLLGKDVPIYTHSNSGRNYKVGYICGINLCGLLFFGMAFKQPRRKDPQAAPPSAQ